MPMPMIETNTNQLLRKKYFVDDGAIIKPRHDIAEPDAPKPARILKASQCKAHAQPYVLGSVSRASGPIDMQMVRNEGRISQIHVKCNCGRHADFDCHYDDTAPGGDGP
jgi:hypothetical protein